MIKTSISLQDLRRKLYLKAKADKTWRFWGLYVHVCKMETLKWAYRDAKENNGAPGIDGVTLSRYKVSWSPKHIVPCVIERRRYPRALIKSGFWGFLAFEIVWFKGHSNLS